MEMTGVTAFGQLTGLAPDGFLHSHGHESPNNSPPDLANAFDKAASGGVGIVGAASANRFGRGTKVDLAVLSKGVDGGVTTHLRGDTAKGVLKVTSVEVTP